MIADTLQTAHPVTQALPSLMILLPSFASAHGKVDIEEGTCVRRVGGILAYFNFNAYHPKHDVKNAYGTHIPGEDDTFIVLGLTAPGLRNMSVGVRILKALSNAAEGQTLAFWPPKIHQD